MHGEKGTLINVTWVVYYPRDIDNDPQSLGGTDHLVSCALDLLIDSVLVETLKLLTVQAREGNLARSVCVRGN